MSPFLPLFFFFFTPLILHPSSHCGCPSPAGVPRHLPLSPPQVTWACCGGELSRSLVGRRKHWARSWLMGLVVNMRAGLRLVFLCLPLPVPVSQEPSTLVLGVSCRRFPGTLNFRASVSLPVKWEGTCLSLSHSRLVSARRLWGAHGHEIWVPQTHRLETEAPLPGRHSESC